MATITKKGITFTIVYIDPSAATAGTGATYDSPLINFPSTIENNKCYLVRRTADTYRADMRVGSYTSIVNLMIMGMPKNTDEEWNDLTDDDVKSAWGSDSYDYANIRWNFSSTGTTTTYSFYVTNLANFIASRCYFFRDSNSPSAQSYCQPMLYSDNTGANANFYLDYCKFSYFGYNMEDPTWRANNTGFTDSTSKYGYNKCGNYFFIRGCNEFSIKNSIINHVPTMMSSYNYWCQQVYGFYFENKQNLIELIGNTINKSYSLSTDTSYGYNYNTFCFGYTPRETLLLNNTINEVMVGTNYFPRSIIFTRDTNNYNTNTITNASYYSDLVMKNNTINWVKMKNAVPKIDYITNSPCNSENNGSSVFYFKGLTSYDIDGLYVNGNISGSEIAYERIINFNNIYVLYGGLGQRRIRNVKMEFSDDYSKCLNWGYGTRDVRAIYITGTTYVPPVYNYQYYSSTGSYYPSSATNIPLLENLDIYCPLGCAIELSGSNLRKAKIAGRVRIGDKCSVEIDKMKNYYATSDGIYVGGAYNYIRVKDYEVDKNSTLFPYSGAQQISFNDNFGSDYFMGESDIYIDKSNCPMINQTYMNSNYSLAFRNNLICPNYADEGQYIQYSKNGYIKSWNTVRTGSTSQASLKCHLTKGGRRWGITLGERPYKGIQITPNTEGNKTLQLHFATKNISNTDLLNKIWLAVEVPNNNDEDLVFEDVYDSRISGAISTETATWSNDTGLQTYVLTLPITIKRTDKPINIRVNYEIFGDNTYTYIDPDVKLV